MVRGLDRVDDDAFTGRHDADDAVARNGAAIGGEAHRQVAVDAADRNGALVLAAGAGAAARPAE